MLDPGASYSALCTLLEAVHAALQVFGELLHTLKVCREMHSVAAAAAKQQSWPCKTSLRMDAVANAAIMQNLAHRRWPMRWLSLKCLYNPLPCIAQVDLTRTEDFTLCELGIGLYTGDPAIQIREW